MPEESEVREKRISVCKTFLTLGINSCS